MGKTVFITGASSGIGRETALYFAQRGWNVIATMRNPANRELTAQANMTYLHLDVTDRNSITEAVKIAIDRFKKIDVLLNNAGYALHGVFESVTDEQIARQFSTNVFGLMHVTGELLPHFREQKAGVVINVSSVGGIIGFPLYSLYQGTKFAVEGFSESLAYELRPLNIKLRLIEPGVINTDFYTRSMDFGKGSGIAEYGKFEERVARKQVGFKGITPLKVARVIYKAAVSSSWRLRYPVGPDARQLLFMKKLLPFSWLRGILRRILA